MLHHLLPLICSPWLYVIVFVAVAIDGFFPVMPSETLVIGLFALSATGSPNVFALLAVVAAGGIAGDRITYRLGRRAGRLTRGRMAEVRTKGERALLRYGGAAILVGRFIPYGRTATTVTAGSAGLHPARFRLFSALAGLAWAGYALGLGRIGGATFAHHPLAGAGFGMLLGMVLAAVCALVEKRRSATPTAAETSRNATPAALGTCPDTTPTAVGTCPDTMSAALVTCLNTTPAAAGTCRNATQATVEKRRSASPEQPRLSHQRTPWHQPEVPVGLRRAVPCQPKMHRIPEPSGLPG